MAQLEVQTRDVPAAADPGKPAATVVSAAGEAVVDLEPLVSTLQTVGARRPQAVVIDLSQLTFMSSLAMGVILAFRRNVLAHGGRVKVAAVQPLVLDSFRRARLDKVFDLVDSVDVALAAVMK
jgi:anti-anti-sigma factor